MDLESKTLHSNDNNNPKVPKNQPIGSPKEMSKKEKYFRKQIERIQSSDKQNYQEAINQYTWARMLHDSNKEHQNNPNSSKSTRSTAKHFAERSTGLRKEGKGKANLLLLRNGIKLAPSKHDGTSSVNKVVVGQSRL